jgi:hypothetical protein
LPNAPALGQRTSARFVAGTQVADAIRAAAAMNKAGISATIDNLGENVTNAAEAHASAQLYHHLLDEIAANKLNANVSVKLTHMGLDVDQPMAYEIVRGLVAKAAGMSPRNFVRVDMEGSPYTERTLNFVHELHHVPGNEDSVGAVIQSYMRRAEADIEKLLSERIRIRLCKGAYKEPEDIAFQKKSEVDASYVKLMKILMKSGVYHGLATHDEAIIKEAKAFATAKTFRATPSNSRCSTASAATCSRVWSKMAGACASTSPSAPSGIPTSCGGWPSAPPMCCLSRKTFCASKLRHVPQSVASATRDVAKVIIRERSRITAQILSIKCEGIFPAFSLYRVEAILDWVHQLAPSACAWNQHRAVGPWLATVWHRDSGFPL